MQSIIFIFPELFLSIMIMSLLMLGIFIKKSFKLIYLLTILSLIFTIALVLNQPTEVTKIFNDSYIIDKLSIFMKSLTLLFCLFIEYHYITALNTRHLNKFILVKGETVNPNWSI